MTRDRRLTLLGRAAVCAGVLYFAATTLRITFFNREVFSDFPTFYAAGAAVRTGNDLYGLHIITDRLIAANANMPFLRDVGSYLYPPLFAGFMAPFSLLSYGNAKIAWGLVNLVVLALIGKELVRLMPDRRYFWFFAGVALASFPVRQAFVHGQLELLMLYALLVALRFEIGGRRTAAGVVLGITAAIKLYPLLFLGVFALRRQWRTVAVGLSTFVVALGLSVAVITPHRVKPFFATTLPHLLTGTASAQTYHGKTSHAGTRFWPNNYSLSGLFAHTLTRTDVARGFADVPTLATVLYVVTSLTIVSALIPVIRNAPETDPRPFLLAMLAVILVLPLSWEYYLVLSFPTFFLLCRHALDRRWRAVSAVLCGSFGIIALDVYSWYPFERHGPGTLFMSIKILALIAAAVTGIVVTRRSAVDSR